MSFGLHF
jgi:hypothetical protein